jgi:hypothetical protein
MLVPSARRIACVQASSGVKVGVADAADLVRPVPVPFGERNAWVALQVLHSTRDGFAPIIAMTM